MQMRLEPLYPPIRNKLANALQRWHPSDASARLILQPWKDVFTPGAWEAFMVKNIVPKLGVCLGQLANNFLDLHFCSTNGNIFFSKWCLSGIHFNGHVCWCVAAVCLGELVVNPHQQMIEPFNWVMDWEGMLSLSSMVGLLDKHFFNKWLQVGPGILHILFLHYAHYM